MEEGLTQKQANIYNAIMKYKIENGYPPTLNELGEMLNKSVGAVRHGLRILERKGYIEVEGNRSRAIKVIK